MKDRNGAPFEGTVDELRRHNDRLRKQEYRASLGKTLVLPLPPGTAAALDRTSRGAGFDDPREFLATVIHRLDELGPDSPIVEAFTKWDRPALELGKYLAEIGAFVPPADPEELKETELDDDA